MQSKAKLACAFSCIIGWIGSAAQAAVFDVTEFFSVSRSGLVFNRTTNTYDSKVTIKNIAPYGYLGPVQVLVLTSPSGVALSNAQGMSESGVPLVNVIPAGEQLALGRSVSVVLKFSNPQRIAFTTSINIRAETGAEVADPGRAGKQTLAGIDSNNNGVRDDVEVYIERTVTDSARHRKALHQYAAAIQKKYTALNKESIIDAANESGMLTACIFYLGKTKENRRKEVEALMTNTRERLDALDRAGAALHGTFFRVPPPSQLRSQCPFDVESLPN